MIANQEILFARRRLEEIENLEIVEDLKWDNDYNLWYILIKVHVKNVKVKLFPENTMWYIVFQDIYPKGNIDVYPAVKDGINMTFNHQNNNGKIHPKGLWRMGKLCLNNPLEEFVKVEKEPKNYEDRLFWYAERAVSWITAAATEQLICKGDYYELPDFNIKETRHIIYNEDLVSIMEWEDSEEKYGYVNFIYGGNNQYYSNTYLSLSGNICKTTRWGKYVTTNKEITQGAWIFLDKEPVINGYQAPNTFKELELALKHQHRSLKDILEKLIPRFRDGKKHIIMIGFPIPEKIGERGSIIRWESFLLPVLSYGKKTSKGFRSNELGWKRRDFQEIITSEREIDWLIAENWQSNEILNRGRFKKNMFQKKILLIGAGTLGASIGENLVRGGIYKLTIMDDDIYTIGNSARHILAIDSVGKNKAAEIARYYNAINPNITIKAVQERLNEDNINITDDYDVILDCTANNDVLYLLETYKADREKIYISISFSYKAEILYFAYQKGCYFNVNRYVDEFGTTMRDSEKNIDCVDLPWEGTGCWHPVFPAMSADVQLIAALATDLLKTIIENDKYIEKYYIYQKKFDEDGVLKEFARI